MQYGKQKGWSDRLFLIATNAILIFFLIVISIPLIYVLSSSFSSPEAIATGRVYLWPVEPSLEGYKAVFTTQRIWTGFRNSILVTVCGTCINIVMTMLAAYPLSRSDLKLGGVLMKLFTFTMLFSGGMIPSYLLVRNLGLIDTYWALILPGAISVYNLIIARTYIMSALPQELYDSASLDGCTDDRYLVKIVIPLCRPILAVLVLWYAVDHWNAYFSAMIYLRNNEMATLQIVLRDLLIVDESLSGNSMTNVREYIEQLQKKNLYQYAIIVVSCVPVMLLYPFIQKHFVKGIMLGSIKG